MAQEVHRLLRVAVLELSVCRTHTAQGLYLAINTLRKPGQLSRPNFVKKALPTFAEAPGAEVIFIALGQHTNTHLPRGVDRERTDAAATVIDFFSTLMLLCGAVEMLDKFLPLLDASRVLCIERDYFLRTQSHRERALRAIDSRIHHCVEGELQPKLLFCEPLHIPNFVFVD